MNGLIVEIKRGCSDLRHNNTDWRSEVGQQLQVANQQIVLCQQKIQQSGDDPQKQLFLQNALGAVSKAWQTIDDSAGEESDW